MKTLNTNSTGWPESTFATRTRPVPQNGAAGLLQARLALLADLATSLRASQHAVLSRDVTRLEKLTAEQEGLGRALALHGSMHLCAENSVQAAQDRALHLGRVQLLLLAHARRSLQVLANVMAGSQEPYAPGRSAWPVQPPGRLSSEEA